VTGRLRRAVVAALLLAAPLVAPSVVLPRGPAVAQEAGSGVAGAPARLRLLAVQGVLDPAPPIREEGAAAAAAGADAGAGAPEPAPFSAELRLDAGGATREDLRLVTTVYARAADRGALREALAGDLPTVYSAVATDLDDLSAGTSRVLTTRATAEELSLDGEDRAGVYPLQLEVFAGPDPIASLVTGLVVLPAERPAALPATTVLRLRADAAPLRGDTADPSVEALLAADGPLDALADDLAQATADGSAAGLVLGVEGRLLEDLAAIADGYTRADGTPVPPTDRIARRAGHALGVLAGTARRADVEVLAHPYAAADLVALVRAGLHQQALDLLADGPAAASAALRTPVSAGVVLPPDGLDPATLAALGPAGADAVLLDEAHLAFARDGGLEPVRRLRTADGGEVRVLVPDADLSDLVRDLAGRGTAAVVQQLLAETAASWLAAGDGPTDPAAGVLLALDPLLHPAPAPAGVPDGPRGRQGTVDAVTAAIAEAPWLRPVRLAYQPRSAASELPPAYTDLLADAHAALGPLAALLPEGDPTPDRFAEALRAAPATAYRDLALQPLGAARASDVVGRLQALSGGVAVAESAPITLTATTGEVPVTVVNTGDVALRLRARVQAARFAFPAGDTQTFTLAPRSSLRLTFSARALNPGGFAPIAVTIDDPGAGLVLARARISVRSTAFPIVGLLATVGSAVILLVWGVRQGRRRRRPGRHERTTAAETAA
jgi:hypothetical protein